MLKENRPGDKLGSVTLRANVQIACILVSGESTVSGENFPFLVKDRRLESMLGNLVGVLTPLPTNDLVSNRTRCASVGEDQPVTSIEHPVTTTKGANGSLRRKPVSVQLLVLITDAEP